MRGTSHVRHSPRMARQGLWKAGLRLNWDLDPQVVPTKLGRVHSQAGHGCGELETDIAGSEADGLGVLGQEQGGESPVGLECSHGPWDGVGRLPTRF